jgi:tetratricopeptide (TPR) repeat protein
MTNEEAKVLFDRAVALTAARDYAGALAALDEVEATRPNSRNVTLQRGICLAWLGRVAEAGECRAKLEGRIEAERIAEITAAIEEARNLARSSGGQRPASPEPASDNVLLVESSFAVTTSETTVTGHVRKGAFRVGDLVSVPGPDGNASAASILRIGPAEMPMQMVRAGQSTVLLLSIEPQLVVNGSYISSNTKETAYAATMVVSNEKPATEEVLSEDLALQVAEAEKRLRQKQFGAARQLLEGLLAAHGNSGAVHRLLSRAHIEGEGAERNPAKALEHAKRAYELGGDDDPAVVGALAEAEAATGNAAQGLRFLERLFTVTKEPQARAAQAVRLTEFRERHGLGHVWEFSDQYGAVIFETAALADAAKALAKGTVPKDGKVRKDRISDWRPIEQALADQSPEIAAVYRGGGAAANNTAVLIVVGIVLVAAIVGGMYFLFT